MRRDGNNAATRREGYNMPSEEVVVSGAGPVGCLLALLLAEESPKRRVVVIEKRPDPSATAGTGKTALKSINLALSDRGRAALRRVGLEQTLLESSVEMTGRLVHLDTGKKEVYQQYDDVDGTRSIYSVSRETVTDVLRARLFAKPNVQVLFGHRITAFQQMGSRVKVTLASDSGSQVLECDALFGCDGTYSSVREAMSRVCRLNFHREYIEMGYSELTVEPPCTLRVNVLHIWPKEEEHGMMMIALPNTDGTFTATLFAPFATLLELQQDANGFQAFLQKHFAECVPFLNSNAKCKAHPLFTSTVSPWTCGSAALMGDAAHAQVPFFGQGMNAGLEDALVFYEIWEQTRDWEVAMRLFDQRRRPCGDAITVLSLENYVEMHTSSSQWWFRASRRIQGIVSNFLPRALVSLPLYYQVAFTRRPYHEILSEKRSGRSGWAFVAAALASVAVVAAMGLKNKAR
ncbi:hypothetical protein BASA81_001411 [Batrachochytrium salamandrivorans]|nr:hypothetical protein BASA81_001411 [Batrachochytrium salamandrivorans]